MPRRTARITPSSVMSESVRTSTPISRAAAFAVMVRLSAKARAIRDSAAAPTSNSRAAPITHLPRLILVSGYGGSRTSREVLGLSPMTALPMLATCPTCGAACRCDSADIRPLRPHRRSALASCSRRISLRVGERQSGLDAAAWFVGKRVVFVSVARGKLVVPDDVLAYATDLQWRFVTGR